jgi:hypothetical protein
MAGLYFEHFEVGQDFRYALTRTATEMDNTLFSVQRTTLANLGMTDVTFPSRAVHAVRCAPLQR